MKRKLPSARAWRSARIWPPPTLCGHTESRRRLPWSGETFTTLIALALGLAPRDKVSASDALQQALDRLDQLMDDPGRFHSEGLVGALT